PEPAEMGVAEILKALDITLLLEAMEPTRITLEVQSTGAFVGDDIRFEGVLTSEGNLWPEGRLIFCSTTLDTLLPRLMSGDITGVRYRSRTGTYLSWTCRRSIILEVKTEECISRL
ncbi:hypothetical protein ACFLWS_06765, partial [Chloroflexota bacterium]